MVSEKGRRSSYLEEERLSLEQVRYKLEHASLQEALDLPER